MGSTIACRNKILRALGKPSHTGNYVGSRSHEINNLRSAGRAKVLKIAQSPLGAYSGLVGRSSGVIRSSGNGNTIVELFSLEISASVWGERRCKEAGSLDRILA